MRRNDSNDNDGFLAAINDRMDDPVVSRVGHASSLYRSVAFCDGRTPEGQYLVYVGVGHEWHAGNLSRPGLVGVTQIDRGVGDDLAIVHSMNFVPSHVPAVINPVARYRHNIPDDQVPGISRRIARGWSSRAGEEIDDPHGANQGREQPQYEQQGR